MSNALIDKLVPDEETEKYWVLVVRTHVLETTYPYFLCQVLTPTIGAFEAPDKESALDYCQVVLGINTNHIWSK